MTQCISRCASAALIGSRACTSARIRSIGIDFPVACQCAFFPLAALASITLNSASSISCTVCRSLAPRGARRRSISRKLALRRPSAMVVRRSIRSIPSKLSLNSVSARAVRLSSSRQR